MIIYVSFFPLFFPNIVTSYLLFFFKVRVPTYDLSRVGCNNFWEWRPLRTRNLAPSRSLTPQRLHPKFGSASGRTSEGCERCRYACRDRSCSPTVPVVTSHVRVDERARGASDDPYACCRRSCSPTRYVTQATLRVYCDMGLLGFCEE